MKVLFLCDANICRSPLAEVVLRKKLIERGLADVEVESAGIHNMDGMPRDHTMISFAHNAGYDMGGTSKYLTQEVIDSTDLIVCMTFHQVVEIQRMFVPYIRWGCIHRFNEICFDEKTDLIDPFGDSSYIYSEILKHIVRGCETLAWKIERKIRHGENLFERK